MSPSFDHFDESKLSAREAAVARLLDADAAILRSDAPAVRLGERSIDDLATHPVAAILRHDASLLAGDERLPERIYRASVAHLPAAARARRPAHALSQPGAPRAAHRLGQRGWFALAACMTLAFVLGSLLVQNAQTQDHRAEGILIEFAQIGSSTLEEDDLVDVAVAETITPSELRDLTFADIDAELDAIVAALR